ncbi:peptide ABC transporter substrate-binding protein [Rhodoferax koreense]|uniref:Peptide ABC transporter substrate-binding protein n=1 Tax=Rhodoferax koreensis TaxID=1842727 RepID=A0A1P8JST5_9BURK|nr:ABC transporter substrate-binding protein [Rhodoferax koreense]APW36781.1 peptide ABC transporter substrate-binding protein [Rhodoferax koreense]
MKPFQLKTLIAASSLALATLLTPSAQAAGTLNVAIHQDPGNWDPIATFLVSWGAVGSQVFDGLIMRTPDMKLVPGLATKWEFLDKNTKLRFTLRTGVKFHNGEPFDAEAVKFTFDRLLGEEGKKGPQQSNYNAIEKVVVVNPTTVDFVMKSPDPVLLTKLAGYGAMIVPPKYITEKGSAYFGANPVGTGPFKFAEYKPKVSLSFTKNADYWGGAPKVDNLNYRFITEPATQAAELQAGRIDVANQIPLAMIDTLKKDPKLAVQSMDGPVALAMRYNTQRGIMKDREVRKALTMAVDRDAIIKTILLGNAKPIASFQGELSFGYDPALKPLPFNPAQAKAMLQKAGVKPGSTIQIDFRGSDSNFREVAQAVASYLQGVGITASLKPYDTNVLLNDIIPSGKTGEMWQNQWGGWTFDYDNTAYSMYYTKQRWNPFDDDAKLNALLHTQRNTWDQAARKTTLQEIGRYVADQALEMPLYSLNTIYGLNKRAKNLALPADGRFRFVDATVE